MLGPYEALSDGRVRYRGNNIHAAIDDVRQMQVPIDKFRQRTRDLRDDSSWTHIARLNHRVFVEAHRYFNERGALFTLLPLTTRMISSPGALYGGGSIDYTSDTCPVQLQWFDLEQPVFLSESSQIYLELALAQTDVSEVYSIYNSFRLEHADQTHLSEFHHIEFEGRLDQRDNVDAALELVHRIVGGVLEYEEESLRYFVGDDRLTELAVLAVKSPTIISFAEALRLLREDTGDPRYDNFTTEGTLGFWEEVRLTWICGGLVGVRHYPLLEVPFYHSEVPQSDPPVAENLDLLWPGYREFVGSGQRIGSVRELEEKAEVFNLPRADYEPYMTSRLLPDWRSTAGFGMGWERLLQGLLELPAIWDVCHYPRTHLELEP